MEIDIRTLSVIFALTYALEALAFGFLYVNNKKYPGVAWWALGSTVVATGYLFLLFRDITTNLLIAIILPNILIISGSLMIYVGILRFHNKKENPGLVLSLLALFIAAYFYFTYVISDITVRTAIISLFLALIYFLMAWTLYGKKIWKIGFSTHFLAAIMIVQGSFLILRSVIILTILPVESLFTPTSVQIGTALIFFIFGFLFTIGLINLVNQRLNAEVTEAKEEFELIFHHSPAGVLITRLDDGRIVDANEGFLRLTGFSREDVVGSSTFEDQLWKNPGDHRIATEDLKKIGFYEDYETVFHRKDTSGITCVLSARIVTLRETAHIIWVIRDITERKQAEEALRESEEFNRNLVQNLPDYIIVYESDGKILYVNPVLATALGYDADKLVDTPILSYIEEKHRDEVISRISERKVGGEVPPYEINLISSDGRQIPVVVKGTLIQYHGNPAVLLLLIDITERKVAEENLVTTLKRTQGQQAVLNTISFSPLLFSGDVHGLSARLTELSSAVFGVERVSVWLFNSKGDELRCIDLYEVLYDRHSYDAVLNRHEYVNEFDALSTAKYIDAHDPLTDPRTAGYVNGYLKPNRITSMLDAVIRVSGQNLGVLCFEHVDSPHHWENDEITFACQLADQIAITLLNRDRNLAEEALQQSEKKLALVMDGVPVLLTYVDTDLRFIYVNKAYADWYGRTSQEIVGKQIRDLLNDEVFERALPYYQKVLGGNSVSFDNRTYDGEGKERFVSVRLIPFHDGKRVAGFFSSILDITERKRAEESLRKSNKKLNLLSRITRHDINNQLTVLVGYLQILESEQPDTTHNEYFQMIATAAQLISAMIQFTKEYDSIGVNAPVWQDCRILVDTAAKQAPLGKVVVKNDFPAGAEVFADPLIVKVFYTLMDNAVRYGGKITTIRFYFDERDGNQIIVCEDDGEGVSADEKERIFEQGFGKNTGLGLALSRVILDITELTLRETGDPGKGARFEMTVPKGMWRIVGNGA